MTADEARKAESQFGRIEAKEDKQNYPHVLYGTIVKVDSYYLLFETTADTLLLFNLRKVKGFTPVFRRRKLVVLPVKHRDATRLQNAMNFKMKEYAGRVSY